MNDSTETGGCKEKKVTAKTGDFLEILIFGSKSWIPLVLSDSNVF